MATSKKAIEKNLAAKRHQQQRPIFLKNNILVNVLWYNTYSETTIHTSQRL